MDEKELKKKWNYNRLQRKLGYIPSAKRDKFLKMELFLQDCKKSIIDKYYFIGLIQNFQHGIDFYLLYKELDGHKYGIGYDDIIVCNKRPFTGTLKLNNTAIVLYDLERQENYIYSIKDIIAIAFVENGQKVCKYIVS